MPAHQQDGPNVDQEADRRRWRAAAIGSHVLLALGEPDELRGVQVRPLWPDHYRVNVLVGADAASVRVAHSYFLVADGDGNVLCSAPEITRQYGPPGGGLSCTLSSPLPAPGTGHGE
jgi:hypothetical protein